jgi:hypothetical protein
MTPPFPQPSHLYILLPVPAPYRSLHRLQPWRPTLIQLRILITALALSTAACAAGMRAPSPDDSPENILAQAIDQAGGAEALRLAGALEWEGVASVHAGDRDVQIAGRWQVQPPDSAVVSTYEVSQGRKAERSLVLAAPRGWLVTGDRFTPMPANMLASERSEFYLYELIRLVTLLDSDVKLAGAPADSLAQVGIRVDQPDRPTAWLYVDTCGRLSHIRMQVPSAQTGELQWQDAWLEGVIEAGNVRWPRELRLLVDGKPYLDLLLQSFRVTRQLKDPLLRGPR